MFNHRKYSLAHKVHINTDIAGKSYGGISNTDTWLCYNICQIKRFLTSKQINKTIWELNYIYLFFNWKKTGHV